MEAFVSFSRRIGAKVVAEGIENRRDLLALQEREVDFGQGFLLGRSSPTSRSAASDPAAAASSARGHRPSAAGKARSHRASHRSSVAPAADLRAPEANLRTPDACIRNVALPLRAIRRPRPTFGDDSCPRLNPRSTLPLPPAFSARPRSFLAEPRFRPSRYLNPDGSPLQAVIWYELEDDAIVFNSRAGPALAQQPDARSASLSDGRRRLRLRRDARPQSKSTAIRCGASTSSPN